MLHNWGTVRGFRGTGWLHIPGGGSWLPRSSHTQNLRERYLVVTKKYLTAKILREGTSLQMMWETGTWEVPYSQDFAGKYSALLHGMRQCWGGLLGGARGGNRNSKFPTPKICVKILSEPGEVPHSKYFAGRYFLQMECDNIGGANRNPKFPTPKICVEILSETWEVRYLTANILQEGTSSQMRCDKIGGANRNPPGNQEVSHSQYFAGEVPHFKWIATQL
jgi:hypothetical protein